MGLAKGRRTEASINYSFLSHAIRDVFDNTNFSIIYGPSFELKNILNTPEHGIGAHMMHSERECSNFPSDAYFWFAGINDPFFAYDSCDLFISINYDPYLGHNHYEDIASQLVSLMKQGGLIFLVNPGLWACCLKDFFFERKDLEFELKRFAFLKEEKVFVYENI